jgi:CRISPR-associated protein Csx10
MIRYYLRLRAESAVSVTSHHNVNGQASATMGYIAGNTLRSALAWKVLRARPAASQEPAFRALFDAGGLACGPLYPLSNRQPTANLSLPLPLTTRTCKLKPGFITEPDPDHRGHGCVDALVAAIEETASGRVRCAGETAPADWRGLAVCERCQADGCGKSLDRFTGYYQFGLEHRRSWHRRVVGRRKVITRTAIQETLENARPGALFSREVLEAGQEFAGFIEIEQDWVEEFKRLWPSGSEIQVGAGRTAGLGRLLIVALQPGQGMMSKLLGPVSNRHAAFQAQLPASLRQRWVLAPLTLLTDAILLDPWLRYASAPEPDVLAAYAALEANGGHALAWPVGTELFLAVANTQRIAGWKTAGEARPRSDDLALVAGSVFVLAAPPEQEQALLHAATWLETHGLGERRGEGFGQVVVAHPFHSQKEAL